MRKLRVRTTTLFMTPNGSVFAKSREVAAAQTNSPLEAVYVANVHGIPPRCAAYYK